jgi:hypothetical protein
MRTVANDNGPGMTMTVGDLISELCRWPDNATLSFRCPFLQQELRVHHIEGRTKGVVDLELEPAPESAPVVPA